MRIEFIEDSELYFGHGVRAFDPRAGLLNGGPKGPYKDKEVDFSTLDCGIIGDIDSIIIFESIIKEISSSLKPLNSTYGDKGFPGLGRKSPLQISINIEDFWKQKLLTKEISDILGIKNQVEAKTKLIDIFERKIELILANDSQPSIIIVLIPDELLDKFDEKKRKRRIIKFANKTLPNSIVQSGGDIDFHNIIKVIGMKNDITTQIIKFDTLKDIQKGLETGKYKKLKTEDPVTFAWNLIVGIYYKAKGTPWKLSELEDNVCYIGISFFRDYIEHQMALSPNLRASVAQVFLSTGESYILRGEPFKWDDDEFGKTPHLTKEYAKSLIDMVLDFYKEMKNNSPKRIVIHKSSNFNEDEIKGFQSNKYRIIHIDMVTIFNYTSFRTYRQGRYPVVRGTLFISEKRTDSNFLFTTGFLPILGTYPGPRVPEPLEFRCFTFDSEIKLIASEILSLSRLDWNNIKYSSKLPVTLLLSERVGDIMSEAKSKHIGNLKTQYRFYM